MCSTGALLFLHSTPSQPLPLPPTQKNYCLNSLRHVPRGPEEQKPTDDLDFNGEDDNVFDDSNDNKPEIDLPVKPLFTTKTRFSTNLWTFLVMIPNAALLTIMIIVYMTFSKIAAILVNRLLVQPRLLLSILPRASTSLDLRINISQFRVPISNLLPTLDYCVPPRKAVIEYNVTALALLDSQLDCNKTFSQLMDSWLMTVTRTSQSPSWFMKLTSCSLRMVNVNLRANLP